MIGVGWMKLLFCLINYSFSFHFLAASLNNDLTLTTSRFKFSCSLLTVSSFTLFILILNKYSPSFFFLCNFSTLLCALIIVVYKIDYFFLFIDSNLLEATNDASLWCLSWMCYFSRVIFSLITNASLYLPSLTSRFFLSSSSVSLVEVNIEYLLRDVCTNLLSSLSKDLFLKSIVWWILYFVLVLNYPIYSFHYF